MMAETGVGTGVIRRDIEVIRQDDRVMLFDRQADAYYRISEQTAEIIGYMTENLPLDEFREKLARTGIDVSAEDLFSLVSFLYQNNLLEPGWSTIVSKRSKLREMREKTRVMRWSAAYMYFKLPPWHPEKFFAAVAPYVSFLASKWFISLLAIPALIGYLLVIGNFSAVHAVFADTLSWAGAVKYFAAILLLKVVHEVAHSLAAIHFNCRVRGIGIGFMIFYPRLYTDTTDSWKLPRRQRLLIDAAGIIAELLCGGIAAVFYFYLPPGVWQSTMFYIFAVSTVSTLLVNGNPCIRYDGYYILCDLTRIDNLMGRAGEYLRQWWRYRFLNLGNRPSEPKGWFLLLFGVLSFVYRIFLYTAIIMVIYHKFVKVIAVILLILEVFNIFIHPCIREIRAIRKLSANSAGRAGWILGTVIFVIVAAILFVPLNWSVEIYGEVVPEKRTQVPAVEGGFLTGDLPAAREVDAGEVLFTLESPQLDFAREKMAETLKADIMQYELEKIDENDFARSQVTLQAVNSDRRGVEELDRRQRQLSVCAEKSGIFTVKNPLTFQKGRYIPKGMVVGEVVSRGVVIYAYADEHDAGKIRIGNRAEVYAGDQIGSFPATVIRVEKVAVPLNDSPLLQIYGGEIPMYQNGSEPGKFHSVRLFYRIELEFDGTQTPAPGRRVHCKISHREQLYRHLMKSIIGIFHREF